MELVKETTISVMTTDGQKLKDGDVVVLNLSDKCCVGVFKGITKKGAIRLDGVIGTCPVVYNIMPRSIKQLFRASVEVNTGKMNPPVEKEREE